MKLSKLSPQQKERLPQIRKEYIDKFLTFSEVNKEKAIKVITFAYSLINKPCPSIYKVSSPKAGQLLANKMKGTKNKFYTFGSFLTIGWASFYAYYDAFVEFGIITESKFPKYLKLREFVDSGIFLTIEFENAIIVIEKPIFIKRLNGRMHCTDGPAIKWRDGYEMYFINGRCMPKEIFSRCLSGRITKKDFIQEENEDIKAGIYEIMESKGEGTMLTFLGAQEVDRHTFAHANGELEEMILYKTKEKFESETDLTGRSNVPLAWLKMSCPSTNTNYLIPSDSSFNNCIDAAKYHRPNEVPTKLDYLWNSRN